jgi:hypothetical protein
VIEGGNLEEVAQIRMVISRLALKGESGKPLPAALEIQNKPGATEKTHRPSMDKALSPTT